MYELYRKYTRSYGDLKMQNNPHLQQDFETRDQEIAATPGDRI